jgi:hypothetical protein
MIPAHYRGGNESVQCGALASSICGVERAGPDKAEGIVRALIGVPDAVGILAGEVSIGGTWSGEVEAFSATISGSRDNDAVENLASVEAAGNFIASTCLNARFQSLGP